MSEPATGIAPIEGHRRGRFLRWVVLGLALAFVATAIVLPLININRYHRTIADSLTPQRGPSRSIWDQCSFNSCLIPVWRSQILSSRKIPGSARSRCCAPLQLRSRCGSLRFGEDASR